MKKSILISSLTILFLFASSANAALWNFDINLDGLQEFPPNASPGFGTGTGIFDDSTGMLSVNGNFASLIGTSTNAHVHGYAPPSTASAGVVFGISYTPGVTSGTFSGSGAIAPANYTDLMNGLAYVNIHTTAFPGGEIRGQLIQSPVPEPGTFALLGISSLFAFVVFKRRAK